MTNDIDFLFYSYALIIILTLINKKFKFIIPKYSNPYNGNNAIANYVFSIDIPETNLIDFIINIIEISIYFRVCFLFLISRGF
jgi:hypothetical protein